ncbi:hypothetical protein ACFQ78_37175 [Streptomyces sp. NPDC056519]|uniref:hypothetical protein n=1 Tax=Streptomyces sp. NPDC056519 TaxID=3345849 RepID=UPI00367B776B
MRTPLRPGRADELLLAVLRPPRPRLPSDDGERSVVLVEAASRAERAVRVLGLHRDMVSFGGDPTVHGCTLRLPDGTVAARGTGAGDAFAARPGALLEALEQVRGRTAPPRPVRRPGDRPARGRRGPRSPLRHRSRLHARRRDPARSPGGRAAVHRGRLRRAGHGRPGRRVPAHPRPGPGHPAERPALGAAHRVGEARPSLP